MTRASLRCPTCHRQFDMAQSTAVPFCSERCREIDLGRWLDERQGLPLLRDPEDDQVEEDTDP